MKNAARRRHSRRPTGARSVLDCKSGKKLLRFLVLALLVCDAAARLASGLAGCLAFAAAAVLRALAQIAGFQSLNAFHIDYPPIVSTILPCNLIITHGVSQDVSGEKARPPGLQAPDAGRQPSKDPARLPSRISCRVMPSRYSSMTRRRPCHTGSVMQSSLRLHSAGSRSRQATGAMLPSVTRRTAPNSVYYTE